MKLLSEIDPSEIDILTSPPKVDKEGDDYFKNEQMNLKKQQEQKYKELQRFQQEYL